MKKTYTRLALSIFFLMQMAFCPKLYAQGCWSPLGTGIDTNSYNLRYNTIYALTIYNGNLIAGGAFDTIGGGAAADIAAWNGSSWSALGSGFKIDTARSFFCYISGLAVYNGELYAAGQFDTAGGIPAQNIAKWNGISWSPVGSGIPGNSFTIQKLIVYKGALYAGGTFDTAGGIPVHNIAKWDGSAWSDVDMGVLSQTNLVMVYCFATDDSLLYVGGLFDEAGSIQTNNIAIWNDSTWSTFGNGVGSSQNLLTSMAFYQGGLYVSISGVYSSLSAYSIAEWNGGSWIPKGRVVPTGGFGNPGVDALFVFDGKLIAGGEFDTIEATSASGLAQWDGATWTSFAGGVSGTSVPQVDAIFIYNNRLYIGGEFVYADNTASNSVAEYTCDTLIGGIKDVLVNSNVLLYPNPTTGLINISMDEIWEGTTVQIYDLMGQKVMQVDMSGADATINMKGKSPGIYLCHILDQQGGVITNEKFVLE